MFLPVILAKNLCRSNEFWDGKILIKWSWRNEWGIAVIVFAHRQHLKIIESSISKSSIKSQDELGDNGERILMIHLRVHHNIQNFPNENSVLGDLFSN